jgi:NTE family protein
VPFGSEGEEEATGLALSGGGYRAMLFHLGALWRLNELSLLPRLDRISSVSGGSLVSARLAVAWPGLLFGDDGVATNFEALVARPVLAQSARLVDWPAMLLGLLPFASAPEVAARFYRPLLEDARLAALPERPEFILNATHFATATNWRFSRRYMGSHRLGLVPAPDLPLVLAVAASAAFPPFLSPLLLDTDPDAYQPVDESDLFHRRDLKARVSLTDGGVFDNHGIEPVWRRCHTVLFSDAGGELSVRGGGYRFWPRQMLRVLDTAVEQGRNLSRRALLQAYLSGAKRGTFWRTGTDIDEYPVPSPFEVKKGWRFHLAAIPTRLAPFSRQDRLRLVNWGYLVADVALRSHFVADAEPPPALPFPAFDFAAEPPPARRERAGDWRPSRH